ncbi:glycosyltransferase family 2 protein [Halomonas sp. McH1-25]|uniref:glycosyltransferase family 2 protein n=1 Tax=unclassified Halomonas TaxID=2609666 RepID=UPI001EF5BDA1|nr:glycosyltransferase family 2 protein [Halomonas sp. McH1-25]MCP1342929.1 glycosyltransferase family 2 protein [Halomonas sp. FL8]MCP1359979.1 glycosyltransferase family 2 protein [Halomonas sp. BBD45]
MDQLNDTDPRSGSGRNRSDQEQQVNDLRQALQSALSERDEAQKALAELESSRSWRLTRPMRDGVRYARQGYWHLRAALRRGYWITCAGGRHAFWYSRAGLRHTYWHGMAVARRLPGPVKRCLRPFHNGMQRLLLSPMADYSGLPALQAMGERRLAELDSLGGGWVAAAASPPATLPKVVVSVVTYNSARWLPSLIDSLLAQRYPLDRLHLVFVDNDSSDDTREVVEKIRERHGKHFAGIDLHPRPNLGFGAAHNWAVRHSDAEYILITNPDLEFDAESITRIVNIATHDAPDVASWELRQRPFEHPKHYDPVSWETHWSSHACILLSRQAFEAIDGYDERIFLYGEDVEYSFRCREAGYRLRYCPIATVAHYTYEEANQVKPAQYLGSTRANLYLRLRYGTSRDQLSALGLAAVSLSRRPFPGARRRLLSEYRKLLRQLPTLRRERKAANRSGIGVFKGFDYELTRQGAFVEVPAPESDLGSPPLVSVITRTYQGRDWLLKQAALSVFNQTYPNLEWIVVEDGGETNRDLVHSLAESAPCRVRFASQKKLGRSAAGNLGLFMAEGTWCLFLDDDDLLYADHIEILVDTLRRHANLIAAITLAWDVRCDVDHDQRQITEYEYYLHPLHCMDFDHERLAECNLIPIQSILFPRQLYTERGGFDESLEHLEDWNLWRRYAHGNDFQLIKKTTSLFRTPAHPSNSQTRQAQLDAAYRHVKALTDEELKAGQLATPKRAGSYQ